MIELLHVRKVFNSGRPNEFVAVNDIGCSIDFHKVTVLKGPSGSGKTTLLSIIGCMSRPTSGRIFLSGNEITSLPERFLTEIRRKTFGFIFQQFHLINTDFHTDKQALLSAKRVRGDHLGAIFKRL